MSDEELKEHTVDFFLGIDSISAQQVLGFGEEHNAEFRAEIDRALSEGDREAIYRIQMHGVQSGNSPNLEAIMRLELAERNGAAAASVKDRDRW